MTAIIIQRPEGTLPRYNARGIGSNNAQTAKNCVLKSGDVRPLSAPSLVKSLSVGTVVVFKNNDAWVEFSDREASAVQSPVNATGDRYYFTDSTGPQKADDTTSALSLGVPQPSTGPTLTINGTGNGTINRSSVYRYTRVTAWDEESAPSKPSGLIEVEGGEHVSFSGLSDASSTHVTHYRLYRAVAGDADAAWLHVPYQTTAGTLKYDANNEVIYDIPKGSIGGAVDGLGDDQLSITIEVEEWYEPPSDLTHLTDFGNGILGGLSGKQVCFCVPWVPYAWPTAYRYTLDHTGVAMGHISGTPVVFTAQSVYLFDGSSPDAFYQRKLSETDGCISDRSVVNTAAGVFFASIDGLALASQNGVEVLTRDVYLKSQWNDLTPSNLIGFVYDQAYYGFFNGQTAGIIIPLDGTPSVTTVDLDTYSVYGGFLDPSNDKLYLVLDDGSRELHEFDAGTSLTATWKSKIFHGPATNFSCLKLLGQSGASTVTIDVDGVEKFSQSVTHNEMTRLPAGFLGYESEITVTGTVQWNSLGMANAVAELVQHGL